MPEVTIVIPACNQARFLPAALDSVLAQPLEHLTVVVVDDGSTDDTAAIAAQVAASDARVRVLGQRNAGVAAARNAGLRAATGDYVCFLDADDVLLPDALAGQLSILEADPTVAFAYGDVISIDEQGRPTGDTYSVERARTVLSGDIFSSLMLGGYFPPGAALVRRAVLEEIGTFDPALAGHADYELWLRLAGAGKPAVYTGRPVLQYRRHAAGMSRDVVHMRLDRARALEKVLRAAPAPASLAVGELQDTLSELSGINADLRRSWEDLQASLWMREHPHVYDLTEHLEEATRVTRTPDAAGRWAVQMHGEWSDTIFLHPTARLEYVVPTGAPGLMTGAFAMHPAVWDKPDARPTRFHVEVDGRARLESVVDPGVAAERGWHPFELPVPAATDGRHVITLATTLVDRATFCWALWKGPRFLWR